MNKELQEQIDMYNQNEEDELERPNYFERPEDVSRHLLEVEHNPTGVVDLDSARANLNPQELKAVRAIGSLINDLDLAMKLIPKWNFTLEKKFFKNELSTTNVPSRSKHGWAAALSKTDKRVNVQDTNELAGDISDAFEQEVEQGLVGKLRETGILKKKEL